MSEEMTMRAAVEKLLYWARLQEETYDDCDTDFVIKSLSAALDAPATPWLPIDSAPKDGTPVDLWCVDPMGEFTPERGGIRLTDCSWNHYCEHFPDHPVGWVRILPDGNYDPVEGPAVNALGLPPWKPTHYMLTPDAPPQL